MRTMDAGQRPTKRSRPESAKLHGNGALQQMQPPLSINQIDKAMIGKWLREDLEDKYLSLYQDHAKLKEKFREQDDKIRDFKTVLKKKRDEIRQLKVQGGAGAAELRATDQVVKLELRNAELEKQNEQLQHKLAVRSQQQQRQHGNTASQNAAGQFSSYSGSRPRGPNTRILQPHPQQQRQAPPPSHQRQSSLGRSDDMRNERTRLQMANEQLMVELQSLKDRLRAQETEHQHRIQDLQSDVDLARLQSGTDKRSAMQEDLDKVRLMRELREKSAIIEQLQGRSEAHEERMRETVDTNARFVEEMERLKRELRTREREAEAMKESAGAAQSARRRLMEMEHALEDASKEARMLKEVNDKLTNSAFDTERERQWKARELALMTQIRQLEATMHRDVGEKGEFLDQLEVERGKAEQVEKELSGMRIKFYELQQKHETLRDKVKFFSKEGTVNMDELDEALVLVKHRKDQRQPSQLDFLQQVDTEVARDEHRRLREIEASHADTIQELDKTRQLLEAQYRINQDLKTSHNITERRLETVKADNEAKLAESAKLLDIRAARIRKLEKQLRDVAYGTKQFSLLDQQRIPNEEANGIDEIDETVHLQNGENLVEFHIGRLYLTEEGAALMGGDSEPSLFCTWAFYVCELQTSDVVRGLTPDFDKTVQYVVKVDDAFLHYINKEKVKLELFRAMGVSYHSVAACRVSFNELLDSKPTIPVSGRATLIAADGGSAVGTIDYWMRMRVPMEQAMRLFRERAKALGYMSANHQAAAEGLRALDDVAEGLRPVGGANSLCVKIVRCRGLKGRRPDFQPTPYCSYKFFDCDDALSPAIPNSSDPEFHFHQMLTLAPSFALDKYLRTQKLVVWVLDEADPDQGTYLGVARIDLVSLSQNRAVQGVYQLYGPGEQPSGTVELEMGWQFAYNFSAGGGGAGDVGSWTSEPVPLMTGEAELLRAPQRQKAVTAGATPGGVQLSGTGTMGASSFSSRGGQGLMQTSSPKSPTSRRTAAATASASSASAATTNSEAVAPPQALPQAATPKPTSRAGSRASSIGGDRDTTYGPPSHSAAGASSTPPTPQRRPQLSAQLAAAAAERRIQGVSTDMQASQTQVSTLADASVTESITSITDTHDARNGSFTPSTGRDPHQPPPQAPTRRNIPSSNIAYDSRQVDDDNEADYAEEQEEPQYEEEEFEDDETKYGGGTDPPPRASDDPENEVTEDAGTSDSGNLRQHQQMLLTATARQTTDTCSVQVFSVEFDATCDALANPDLDDTECYVVFQLPGLAGQETETQQSLPTPRPGKTRPRDFSLNFNFRKTFDYSFERSYEKRQQLALQLLQDTLEIPFTVVCEASNPKNDFFEDLGCAKVRLDDLIASGEAIREGRFPLMLNNKKVGFIKISCDLPGLLLEVYNEMPESKKPSVKFV